MRGSLLVVVVVVAGCGPKVNAGSPDGAAPACESGATQSCYSGPAGTANVGPCKGGTQSCGADLQWGPCEGELLPGGEVCANGIDDNCNGTVDEDVDLDGDGYTTCGGDCCDSTNDGCASPKLVNPGAFEAPGNMLDDDCDGIVDNAVAANCDTGLASDSTDPFQYAAAMELCQTTTASDTKWGVLSAQFLLADGTGAPLPEQHAIRPDFGATLVQSGASFTVLSTGHAATPTQTNPGYLDFQTGSATLAGLGSTSGFPNDFLMAHNGTLPNSPGCPTPDQGSTANDPVMLQLQIRTPTNAKSFSFSMNFMSSEYPEWTCSLFNDFFVVLLDSQFAGTPANPADKNLAIYTSATNQVFPVGVNLAHGDTGLFTQCKNGPTGCTEAQNPNLTVSGTISTCTGIGELAGTGMDLANPNESPPSAGFDGYCGANNLLGGGTGWLTTSGNVVGGEVITLRIALWDTSDGTYDSVAIIDNFKWSVEASQPGTILQKPTH